MLPNRETEPARPVLQKNDGLKKNGATKRGASKIARRSAAWAPASITRAGLTTRTGYAGLDGATGRAIGIGTIACVGGDTDAGRRYAPPAITTGCLGAATGWPAVCCALIMRGVKVKAAAVAQRNTSEREIRPQLFDVERSIRAIRPSELFLIVSILLCISARNRYLCDAAAVVDAS
jgi:hypothetical protein